jgi:hypothetical protein
MSSRRESLALERLGTWANANAEHLAHTASCAARTRRPQAREHAQWLQQRATRRAGAREAPDRQMRPLLAACLAAKAKAKLCH